MDINPLIADLIKYKEELLDTIENALWFKELNKADVYVANSIAEIKGEKQSDEPFQQVAMLYSLPLEEVVCNIRSFTNKGYRTDIMNDFVHVDIVFETKINIQNG